VEKRFLFCLLLLFIFSARAGAQNEFYQFQHITSANGLPSDNVSCLLQDADGFIWIGTSEGLARYDGYEFRIFRSNPVDTSSVSANTINALYQDQPGRIWVGTSNGLNLFDLTTYKFRRFFHEINAAQSLANDNCSYIFNAGDHRVGICTLDGFSVLNFDDFTFTSYYYERNNPKSLTGKGFGNAVMDHGMVILPTDKSINILDLKNGTICNAGNNPKHLALLNCGGVSKIFKLKDSSIYFTVYGGGVSRYDRNMNRIVPFSTSDSLRKILSGAQSIIETTNQIIFTTDNEGVIICNKSNQNFQQIKHDAEQPQSLSSNNIRAFIIDREGNYWIGTDEGINFRSQQAQFFKTRYVMRGDAPNDYYKTINAMIADRKGNIWLALAGMGIRVIDGPDGSGGKIIQNITWNSKHGITSNSSMSLYCDRGGSVWYSDLIEFAKYDASRNQFNTRVVLHNDTVLRYSSITSMLEDDAGKIWMGCSRGLFYADTATLKITWVIDWEKNITGSKLTQVNDLTFDRDGKIWIAATGLGLIRYDPQTKRDTMFLHRGNDVHSVPSDMFNGLLLLDDGKLLVSTSDAGIFLFDPKTFSVKTYSIQQGLASNFANDLYADHFGNIWIQTENGLSRFNRATETFTNYGVSDGIPALRFYNNPHTHIEWNDTLVWMADFKYIIEFNPKNFLHYASTEQVKIISVSQFDRELFTNTTLPPSLNFSYKANSFRVDFSTLNFSDLNKTSYDYRLLGSDTLWNNLHHEHFLSFANLAPGNYTLQLRTTGNPEKITSLPIVITPPFYSTWWFRILVMVTIAIIGYLLFRFRIAQIRREEKLKTEFQKKTSDLEMAALRAQMNPHFIFNCLNAISYFVLDNQPERATEYLSKFSQLIRLILDGSRNKTISLENEIRLISYYLELEQLRCKHKFQFAVTKNGVNNITGIEIPSMLLQPFIENAIWHGVMPKENNDGLIEVAFSQSNHHLVCEITDNGIGRKKSAEIKSQQPKKHVSYGMQLTEERLKILNADEADHSLQVEDLLDVAGHSCGTKVKVILTHSTE